MSAQVNDQPYSRRAAAALIVSPDPLAAALVGAAIEVAGFRAAFARTDETLQSALVRSRPSHVLFDCDHPASTEEALVGPALMTGARLFFFGGSQQVDRARGRAATRSAGFIVLPDDMTRLREILTRRPSPTHHEVSP